MKDLVISALIFTLVLALVIFSIWAVIAGPCEIYQYAANKDVPARCIARYQK